MYATRNTASTIFVSVCVFMSVSIQLIKSFKKYFQLGRWQNHSSNNFLLPTTKQTADEQICCIGFPSHRDGIIT